MPSSNEVAWQEIQLLHIDRHSKLKSLQLLGVSTPSDLGRCAWAKARTCCQAASPGAMCRVDGNVSQVAVSAVGIGSYEVALS
jgi:hypothetical protein